MLISTGLPTQKYHTLGLVQATYRNAKSFWTFKLRPADPQVEARKLLEREGEKLGADAIVGVSFNSTYFYTLASGTAVRFVEPVQIYEETPHP